MCFARQFWPSVPPKLSPRRSELCKSKNNGPLFKRCCVGRLAAIWSYPRCELATEGELSAFERLDRAKSTKSLPLKIASQPLFAAFYCPERVPTKHLPPYPATNIIICTSIALPMTQRSTLNIYSSRYRSRAVCLVWRFGLRMVFDRLDTYTQQNENIWIE